MMSTRLRSAGGGGANPVRCHSPLIRLQLSSSMVLERADACRAISCSGIWSIRSVFHAEFPPVGLGHISSFIRVRVLYLYELVRKQEQGVHLSPAAAFARI